MLLGKQRPKVSFKARGIRLGVAHHGAPSGWTAPSKDTAAPVERTKPSKKKHRS